MPEGDKLVYLLEPKALDSLEQDPIGQDLDAKYETHEVWATRRDNAGQINELSGTATYTATIVYTIRKEGFPFINPRTWKFLNEFEQECKILHVTDAAELYTERWRVTVEVPS